MKKYLLIATVLLIFNVSFSQQTTALSPPEKDAIVYMREEEKLARDVYNLLFEKWDVNPFGNVRISEQVHMDKMKTLITNYSLEDPVAKNNDHQGVFLNNTLQKYYDELTAMGATSLTEALKAGAKIEELDIKDLEERIKQTRKQDIISTYTYLKSASENHLRAFVRRLKAQGVSYDPVILGKEEFNQIVQSGNNRGNCMRIN